MRVSSRILAGLASAAVVGIGWQIGWAGISQTTTAPTGSSGASTGGSAGAGDATSGSTVSRAGSSGTSGSSGSSGDSGDSTAAGGQAAGGGDGTFAGSAVRTRYGTMQVQAVISDGRIADVVVLQSTGPDRKSAQISNRAEPLLRQEVLVSQSASVSGVSGATYTSRGYLQSLQAALDAAGFAG